jgi:hypothetical protein
VYDDTVTKSDSRDLNLLPLAAKVQQREWEEMRVNTTRCELLAAGRSRVECMMRISGMALGKEYLNSQSTLAQDWFDNVPPEL